MNRWIDEMKRAAADFNLRVDTARFHFLRHGETAQNKARICQGQQDVPLNETGIEQGKHASLLLEQRQIKTIVASDLRRVQMTIQPLVERTGWPVHPSIGLRERGFGVLEGKPVPMDLWDRRDPGVESVEEFTFRILTATGHALKHPDVLIASHGGVLRAIAAGFDIDLQPFAFANALPLVFSKTAKGFAVDVLTDAGTFDATEPWPDNIAMPKLTTGNLIAARNPA